MTLKQERFEVVNYITIEKIIAKIDGDLLIVSLDDKRPLHNIKSITFLKKGATSICGSGVYPNQNYLIYYGNFDVQVRKYYFNDSIESEIFVYGEGQLPFQGFKV
ncbi:MAG: hypothetical protein KGD59_13410 [Candidatus Heimdallarchaeota archaeon]|nr:hypothetical protein [Candidatus Heimdallarchaeota archaeon]